MGLLWEGQVCGVTISVALVRFFAGDLLQLCIRVDSMGGYCDVFQ